MTYVCVCFLRTSATFGKSDQICPESFCWKRENRSSFKKFSKKPLQTQIQGNFRCKRMLLHCWLIEYWMLIRDLWRFRIYNLGTLESEVSSEVSRGRMGTQGRFFNFIEMYNWLICDKLCQYFEVKHFSTYNMAFVFNPLVIAYIYIYIHIISNVPGVADQVLGGGFWVTKNTGRICQDCLTKDNSIWVLNRK